MVGTQVTYRGLTGDDLQPLIEKMKERFEIPPDPKLTVAFVAESEGRIVAEIVIQKVTLVEPATAEDGHGEHMGKLFEMAQAFILNSGIERALMHPEHPAMKLMLRRAGARPFAEFWQWERE